MKKVLLLFLMIGFISCKKDLIIINSIKQTIVPGVNSSKEYLKYNIDFRNDSEGIKQIEKIIIVDNKTCYKVQYTLTKENSPKQLSVIKDKGNYTLKVAMINGSFEVLTDCYKTKNGLYVFYSEDQQQKEFFIGKFKEERKTRR